MSSSHKGKVPWYKGLSFEDHFGVERTLEIKEKMSLKLKGRIYMKKDSKKKRIFPEELEKFLQDGWSIIPSRRSKK